MYGIRDFTFGLVRNYGPAQRIVVLAQRVDPETNHIDGRLTKGEGCITIQLKYPTCCYHDATKDIQKKPWRSDVQVQDVIRCLQIAADDNRAGEIKVELIIRIVVAFNQRSEPLGFRQLSERTIGSVQDKAVHLPYS